MTGVGASGTRETSVGYYTDGPHWYFNDGGDDTAWQLYRFDKEHKFGGDFERGDYKLPEEGAKIEVPRYYVGRHK